MPIPGFQPLEPLNDFAHGHLVVADLAMLLAAFILREHARLTVLAWGSDTQSFSNCARGM